MSRSGYSDALDNWAFIRWRGAVASAIRGPRSQRLLRDLVLALDELPSRRLIAGALVHDGEYCALGAVAAARNIPMVELDPEDILQVAEVLDVAGALAAEIADLNDDYSWDGETPEKRWARMRDWAAKHILG